MFIKKVQKEHLLEVIFEKGEYRTYNIWECYIKFHNLKFNQVILNSSFPGVATANVVK
jgi:uncharacterized Fe-S cluster-containing MiaB family protein